MAIPGFGPGGILPPFIGDDPATFARSPYECTSVELVEHLATSGERCRLIAGWLRLRNELHNLGFRHGWQWLNGSFLERREGEPNDIDVVTFLFPPDSPLPAEEIKERFMQAGLVGLEAKKRYSCDAYYVEFHDGPAEAVRSAVYWYSLFSHRRTTFEWKGLVRLDLAPADDSAASKALSIREIDFLK